MLAVLAAPRRDPEGRLVGFIGSCVDITDRREMEETLRHSEARLQQAQEAAGFDKVLRGTGSPLNPTIALARQYASFEVPVLITGEADAPLQAALATLDAARAAGIEDVQLELMP